jgi:hypothetical protein
MRTDDLLYFRVLGCLLGSDLAVEGRLLSCFDLVIVDHFHVDLLAMGNIEQVREGENEGMISRVDAF